MSSLSTIQTPANKSIEHHEQQTSVQQIQKVQDLDDLNPSAHNIIQLNMPLKQKQRPRSKNMVTDLLKNYEMKVRRIKNYSANK